jgi:DNA-directed RNA polymerase subunit F
MKPLSLAEAADIVGASEENKDIKTFIKKFTKMDAKKAQELRKEIAGLGMMKIKEEHIVKIIDLLPEDASDIHKIFSDVSLDENEINKLLEVIKKHK